MKTATFLSGLMKLSGLMVFLLGGGFSCSNYAVVDHMQFLWGNLEHGQLTEKL